MTTTVQFALKAILREYPDAQWVNHVNGTFSIVAGKGYSAPLLGGGETKLEALIDTASKLELPQEKTCV